jgi:hypothetical protein
MKNSWIPCHFPSLFITHIKTVVNIIFLQIAYLVYIIILTNEFIDMVQTVNILKFKRSTVLQMNAS